MSIELNDVRVTNVIYNNATIDYVKNDSGLLMAHPRACFQSNNYIQCSFCGFEYSNNCIRAVVRFYGGDGDTHFMYCNPSSAGCYVYACQWICSQGSVNVRGVGNKCGNIIDMYVGVPYYSVPTCNIYTNNSTSYSMSFSCMDCMSCSSWYNMGSRDCNYSFVCISANSQPKYIPNSAYICICMNYGWDQWGQSGTGSTILYYNTPFN